MIQEAVFNLHKLYWKTQCLVAGPSLGSDTVDGSEIR